jgi:hypothetical protein
MKAASNLQLYCCAKFLSTCTNAKNLKAQVIAQVKAQELPVFDITKAATKNGILSQYPPLDHSSLNKAVTSALDLVNYGLTELMPANTLIVATDHTASKLTEILGINDCRNILALRTAYSLSLIKQTYAESTELQ